MPPTHKSKLPKRLPPTRPPSGHTAQSLRQRFLEQNEKNKRLAADKIRREAERNAEIRTEAEERLAQDQKKVEDAAARLAARGEALTPTDPVTEQLVPATSRRRLADAPKPTSARPIYSDPADGAAREWPESFSCIYVRTGAPKPPCVPSKLVRDAFSTGITLFNTGGGYETDGLSFDALARAEGWVCAVVRHVRLTSDDDGRVAKADTGPTGLKLVNSGSFNVAFRLGVGGFALPPRIVDAASAAAGFRLGAGDFCIRMTRPTDNHEKSKDTRLDEAVNEARYAMWASLAGIGVRVDALCAYRGEGCERTCRYGTLYVGRLAQQDLFGFLDKTARESDAFDAGVKAADACYEWSVRGVAFFDMKPANVLVVAHPDGGVDFKLADFDPNFFMVLPDKDWKALMLLNLALLCAHARNLKNKAAADGFARACRLPLEQLLDRRALYPSRWLFAARSVRVSFDYPKDHSDFQLQLLLCAMATSYFFGKPGDATPQKRSHEFGWEGRDQRALDRWWAVPANADSWPPAWVWGGHCPLIEQIVRFALGA
jgi:hypothetical protein